MRSLLIYIFCFLLAPVYPIEPEFRHLTPLDGLNNGTVNDIVEDPSGRMWFATWDGLMRYDGYIIENFRPEIDDPFSLPAKQCSKFFLDSNENLWVVTKDGICRHEKHMDNFIPYALEGISNQLLSSCRLFELRDLLIVSFGPNWFFLETDSVVHSGIFKKLTVLDRFNNPVNLPVRYVNVIDDKLWLCCRYSDAADHADNRIFIGDIVNRDSVNLLMIEEFEFDGNVTALLPYKEDMIFTGTTDGLYLLDYQSKSKVQVKSTGNLNIRDLFISSDNKLWIGTNKSGLGCLDLHNGKYSLFTHDPNKINSILGNVINSIYEDFSGNLWVGFGGEGLSILNLRQKPFETYRHDPNNGSSLSSNTILCFNESASEIMIGTNYDGLIFGRQDEKTGDFKFINVSMPGDFVIEDERFSKVWEIFKETDSLYWLGTNFGLIKALRIDHTWKFEQVLVDGQTGPIRQIFMDKNKNMWLGCYNGLFLLPETNRESMKYFQYFPLENDSSSLSDRVVTAILLDRSGRFWIGTQSGGLNLLSGRYEELDLAGKHKPELEFYRYYARKKSNNFLNNNEINVLFEHPDGTIWMGTQGGGINILDPKTSAFRYITIDNGLAGEDVFSLLPDEYGNLWISTNKGLSCYNLYDNTFNNFTPADGIQGNVFMVNSYFRSATGKLYFGGRNGFTCFDPGSIEINRIAPKIIFSGLKTFNRDVHIGDTIDGRVILPMALSELSSLNLSYKDYNFSIRFSVMHYQNPKENMVEYYLEGFDRNWTMIPASNEIITFNNLPHGNYTLKLRGGNADNIWGEETKELNITILPPWWQTWWAWVIFSAFFVLIIIGIMFLILHRQSLKHLLKIEKIEMENLKELNEEKLRFFTNISHELRTPLSLTIAPIEDMIMRKDYAESYFRKQLNLAHRNAKLLIRLINQIIDFRRLNAGKLKLEAEKSDICELLREVAKNFEAFMIEKNITLSLNLSEEPCFIWFDKQKMEQIIYNLLSNAFKFTHYGGIIEIRIQRFSAIFKDEKPDQWLELVIFNEGKEIPEDQLEKIFERFHKIDDSTEGSGIGLSFTRSLVELHKGRILAESVPGKGARFRVFLQTGEKHLDEEEKRTRLAEAKDLTMPGEPGDPIGGEQDNEREKVRDQRILVIEDNSELREFFKSHFENDYMVLEASNGLEGLKLAGETVPDIIISDIVMPEMDGLQLCRNIKTELKTSHIPVILLTAKDTSEFKISGYDHGADAYVTKPFEIAILDRQVKSLLRNRELVREKYRRNNFMIDISSSGASKDDLFITRLKELIEENLANPALNVSHLSGQLSLSKTQVYRKIKALTGYAPIEVIRIIRLEKAAELLRSSYYTVKEVCYKTGFNSPSYFIKCFREHFNQTPNVFMTARDISENLQNPSRMS